MLVSAVKQNESAICVCLCVYVYPLPPLLPPDPHPTTLDRHRAAS